jgi:hypothetical protein
VTHIDLAPPVGGYRRQWSITVISKNGFSARSKKKRRWEFYTLLQGRGAVVASVKSALAHLQALHGVGEDRSLAHFVGYRHDPVTETSASSTEDAVSRRAERDGQLDGLRLRHCAQSEFRGHGLARCTKRG